MDQPTAGDALKRLEPLIGTWTIAAQPPPGAEPWPAASGRATFEWHESRMFVIQRTAVEADNAPPDSVSIIGCDAANGTYFQLYSDARGVCRVYEMSIGEGEWKLWRNGEPFAQRFVATIDDDASTITGRWEASEDGTNFATDFDLTYRRSS
jgi:hypothetical protein